MRIDTKIVFLTGLQVKTSPKTDCCVAILFLPSKKNSSRMPSWHPPDSDSGSVRDDESIIKVHNDAKTRFSWIWPFGIWTISLHHMSGLLCHLVQSRGVHSVVLIVHQCYVVFESCNVSRPSRMYRRFDG